MSYSKSFSVRWADLDPNRHLRHTAYNDYATHVRFSYLAEHGFEAADFARLGFGPVILREETRFLKEVGMGATISIDFRMAAASPSLDRFRLAHQVTREDGVLAATIEVDGGWMDLSSRKLRPPPDALAEVMRELPRSEDFEELEDRR